MKQPMFAKRHIEAIAELLRRIHPAVSPTTSMGDWRIFKTRAGDMLAESNPRFDRGRFEEACEP